MWRGSLLCQSREEFGKCDDLNLLNYGGLNLIKLWGVGVSVCDGLV